MPFSAPSDTRAAGSATPRSNRHTFIVLTMDNIASYKMLLALYNKQERV